jgi:CubicO group peptidase (beta-lactamase class C family)
MRNFIAGIILVLISFISTGQNEVTGGLNRAADSLISIFMKKWKIPGGSVAMAKEGSMVYSRGFGFDDRHLQKKTKPSDLFRIASVSKPITAMAVMKLVEEGKLDLESKVFGKQGILCDAYYNEVVTDRRIESITVRQLLEHSAGWDRNVPCDGYPHSDAPFFPLHVAEVEKAPNPVGDSTLVRFMLRKGLNFDPGTRYAYSNVGYLVLGKVIEKVSSKRYGDFVKKNLFEPLGIMDIRQGHSLAAQRLQRESYYFNEYTTASCFGTGMQVPWQYGGFNIEAMNAHGGWVASATDLLKLFCATDLNNDGPKVLSAESIRTMSTASRNNSHYALGLCVNEKGNSWHTGSMDGTASFVCRSNDGYTWVFLLNSRSDNSREFWKDLDRLPWLCLKAMEESRISSVQAAANSPETASVQQP